MAIDEKIKVIYDTIKEISAENEDVGGILLEGFGISLNVLQSVAAKGNRDEIDLEEQITMISNALGFSLEEIVMHILGTRSAPPAPRTTMDPANSPAKSSGGTCDKCGGQVCGDTPNNYGGGNNAGMGFSNNSKEADEATLAFITSSSDIEDYEGFLADNKIEEVKDNLAFLNKII